MEPLLLEIPYIGSLAFHALVLKHGYVYIESHEHFQKGSYRNRAHIVGPNGMERLTIPVEEGRGQRKTITKVGISYAQNWPKLHWNAIIAAYGRSPYFEFYEHDLKSLFESKEPNLYIFNMQVLQTTWHLLGMKPTMVETETYQAIAPEGIVDLRSQLHPNPAKDFSGKWVKSVPYYQVFQDKHGYVPEVCVWDLLFNEGPNAKNVLRQMCR